MSRTRHSCYSFSFFFSFFFVVSFFVAGALFLCLLSEAVVGGVSAGKGVEKRRATGRRVEGEVDGGLDVE